MDREQISEHLAQAERHIQQSEGHIARQKELIARLESDGHDTAEAKRLLKQFEQMLAVHVDGRDTLRQELETSS